MSSYPEPDLRTIESDRLILTVSDHGAEPVRLIRKSDGRDLLWCGDPAYWNRHAPVLFPFVGKVQGGSYLYRGVRYPMGQHGFARDSLFECRAQTENSVVHRLVSTEATRSIYPFDFVFELTHRLEGNMLTVHWSVTNPSQSEELYFSVGGHPAFNCPIPGSDQSKSDYSLWLDCKTDSPTYYRIDPVTQGVAVEDPQTLGLTDRKIRLSEELFERDALIFDGQIGRLGLLYPDGTPYITVDCPDALSVGVWSKPNANAPFVCLEPWIGRCDNSGFSGELSEKFGEQRLAPGEHFESSYTITAH